LPVHSENNLPHTIMARRQRAARMHADDGRHDDAIKSFCCSGLLRWRSQ
jgi:hypothetical protein